MSSAEQFLADLEEFLVETGMDPTSFGLRAMNDPRFVFDVRKGRQCSLRTVDRVRDFMSAHRTDAAA